MQTSKILVPLLLLGTSLMFGCDTKNSQGPTEPKSAPLPKAVPKPDFAVSRWGPAGTKKGTPFNVLPSGISALWFEYKGSLKQQELEAWFGNNRVAEFNVTESGGALMIPTDWINAPGRVQAYLIHKPSGARLDIGTFEIAPEPTDVPALKVTKWGPESATVGVAFNARPDGSSALWWEATGWSHPASIEVWFGDKKLKDPTILPYVGGNVVVPNAFLAKPGKYPVYLLHAPSKTKYEIGTFELVAK